MMTFEELREKLQKEDSRFLLLNRNSVLGIILGNMLDAINSNVEYSEQTLQSTEDVLDAIDFLNMYGSKLDQFAQLFGIQRNYSVGGQIAERFYIRHAVKLSVLEAGQTVAYQLQQVFGSLENVPQTIRLKTEDESLVIEAVMPSEWNTQILASRVLILDQYITQSFFTGESGTELVFEGTALGDYMKAQLIVDPASVVYVEDDNSLKLRIATLSHYRDGWTVDSLETAVFSALRPQARNVVVKSLARGYGTADVIIYPAVTYVYDENNNLQNSYVPLQQSQKPIVYKYAPLGIDVDVRDAEQIRLNVYLTVNGFDSLDEDSKQSITDQIKKQIIELFTQIEDITTADDYILSADEVFDAVDSLLGQYNLSVNRTSSYITDKNGVQASQFSILVGQFPVVDVVEVKELAV